MVAVNDKIAAIAMDLEQELGAAGHAAADLERHDRPLAFSPTMPFTTS